MSPGLASTDIVDLFFETARVHAARPAVRHNGAELSYRELADAVRAAAGELGDAPGIVGVLVNRGAGSIVRLLAAMAAGGCYCPVDVALPEQRKLAMTAAIGARRLVRAHPDLPLPRGIEPWAPTAAAGAAAVVGAVEQSAPGPDGAAYLLFTSGSSGTPKPVVTSRRAISASVAALTSELRLTPADRVLQFAALSWDTCFEEILPTLTVGGCLVIDDEAYTGSMHRFVRLLGREAVTVLDLPTAMWHELVLHLAEDGGALPDSVHTVVIGGEPVGPVRLAQWQELPTGRIRLVNTYGCTETTLVTHTFDVAGPLAAAEGRPSAGKVPIGRPLPHVRTRCEPDGELWIAGPALADGYLGLAAETADRFVLRDEDGEGPGAQTRWFRTGDRVTSCADGVAVYEGRIDDELKIRGVRVAPAEVEARITSHPEVAAAAVTGVTANGRNVLVGYVVSRDQPAGPTLAADVIAHVRAGLPEQMAPSRVLVVPHLVHTASGKVDRRGTHLQFHESK